MNPSLRHEGISSESALALHVSVSETAVCLKILDMTSAFAAYIGLPADTETKGLRLPDIFTNDALFVEEVIDYIIKIRDDPAAVHCDARDGDDHIIFTLQYLQIIKGWAIATLRYNPVLDILIIYFSPAEDRSIATNARHLMDLKQDLWLSRFIDQGGYWEMDCVKNTIFVSRSLARTLYLGEDAVIVSVDRFLDTIHSQDRPAVIRALNNVENEYAAVKSRAVLPDGQLIFFSSYGIPEYDENGAVVKIIGRTLNITERERAFNKLQISEKRFRGIVENASDVFVIISPDRHIVYVSPNIRLIAGYDPADVTGRRYVSFVPDAREQRRLRREFIRSLREHRHTQTQCRIRCADGAEKWCILGIAPVSSEPGEATEAIVTIHDISEQMRSDDKLRYMGSHDALTGVWNRFMFEEEMMRIGQDHAVGIGLVIADVNGLKLINDAFGHQKGDEILIKAAGLIAGVFVGDVSLKETLKIRNVETATHMQRMENMVIAMGKKLGLPIGEFDRLVLLASMHDIGKVAIPDHVINKPGDLTGEEWEIMKTHSDMGCRIAMTSQELSGIANEIACHHERWDGGGYPNGYKGFEIPLLSRIISVVDAYDVMTHTRIYKDSMSHEAAIIELKSCAGTQFDPDIVALFTDVFGALSQEKMLAFIYSDPDENKESFRHYAVIGNP
ncbi:MAG: PAS domain S-box protein [Oscillospiraceae bacterium]|nr:PAS domain S-box protein [Oscillospiraceae bacterium]